MGREREKERGIGEGGRGGVSAVILYLFCYCFFIIIYYYLCVSIPIKTWPFCFLWLYSVSASSIESRRAPLTNPSPYAKWDCPFTVMKYSSVHDISISERAKEERRRGGEEGSRRGGEERGRGEGEGGRRKHTQSLGEQDSIVLFQGTQVGRVTPSLKAVAYPEGTKCPYTCKHLFKSALWVR